MINKLKELFLKLEKKKGSIDSDTEIEDKDISLTCAALLIELVFADKIMNAEEIDSLRSSLEKTYELDEATVNELIENGEKTVRDSTSLYEYTKPINEFLEYKDKLLLIGSMWKLAYADGNLDKYEEHLIRKVSDLIHIEHQDFINQKLQNK